MKTNSLLERVEPYEGYFLIKNRQLEIIQLPILIYEFILFARPDHEGKDFEIFTKVTDI